MYSTTIKNNPDFSKKKFVRSQSYNLCGRKAYCQVKNIYDQLCSNRVEGINQMLIPQILVLFIQPVILF